MTDLICMVVLGIGGLAVAVLTLWYFIAPIDNSCTFGGK